ncbi:hypothetical protein [Protofrankia symbiont of Coriaria ruscifolia]|uniref:Uncharacterized protein n=1 Tax=Candidatus Protofrankia californiensis TaxID=1839754 RepID=A0A1C3P1U0_9ACTN|nr:hypothetical protein [Protofrankia symbiont of Coriaria ruscifolia]SBW23773.1 hypothetical protein FDG2_3911 [Candidatus Protofrankia californiensis]
MARSSQVCLVWWSRAEICQATAAAEEVSTTRELHRDPAAQLRKLAAPA